MRGYATSCVAFSHCQAQHPAKAYKSTQPIVKPGLMLSIGWQGTDDAIRRKENVMSQVALTTTPEATPQATLERTLAAVSNQMVEIVDRFSKVAERGPYILLASL